MAKDGTARGGSRVGAGRKPKALADKVAQGTAADIPALPAPADMEGVVKRLLVEEGDTISTDQPLVEFE